MDDDLAGLPREALVAEVRRLRAGIRAHRDSSGHELCWHHPQLWGLLPEKSDPLPSVPAWPEFLRGCVEYRESLDRQRPDAPRTYGDVTRTAPRGTRAETILWRRLDIPGHEIGRLDRLDSGWTLSGTVVCVHDQHPCKLDYVVSVDARWWTNAAHVSGVLGGREIGLRVSVDAERRWRVNGAECPAVTGCMDLDLGFSPSTNVLPIRRLALAVGEEAEVDAAWLAFPSFELELLPQTYRREADRTYRYESRGGAFVRTLEVNAAGFVTSYPGLWEAESTSDERHI